MLNRLRIGTAGLAALVCCILLALLGPDMPDQAARTLLKFLLLGLAPSLVLLWQGGGLRLGCRRQGAAEKADRGAGGLPGLHRPGAGRRFLVDLEPIRRQLTQGGALTARRFLLAGLLIALPGALLEEFFFRGFCFQLPVSDGAPPTIAALFSASLFSLYHAVMIKGWFPPWQTFAAFLALFAAGLLFCLVCRRLGLCAAWLCHMSANLALLTLGLLRFYR